jgi:hypothetical protein
VRREGSTIVLESGLRVVPDRRTIRGAPERGVAHVCAAHSADQALPYDDAAVQQARRDVLAWWLAELGDELLCVTTLALDSVRCAGAITVVRRAVPFHDDPFARLFPGETIETELFCAVPPPPGPVIERYAGAAWPGGGFA